MDCSHNLSAMITTHKPSNEDLKRIIEIALMKNFKHVEVDVRICPDLSKAPFNMTSRGFGNGLRIAEIGGPSNLFPKLHKEKAFDLNEVCATCDAPHAAVFGPGAGPWPVVGVNCEMVADANLSQGKSATKITYIEENSSNKYQAKIIDSTKFSLMANLAVSENDDPSEVVHFKCSIRTGQLNLPETIRRAIAEHYTDKPVSLAGLFILHEGEAKLHVMPDFPSCPFNNTDEIQAWLQFFTMRSPLVCASVIHSYDPGYSLRMEHTHCYSDHGDSGHYHNDCSPYTVVYEGWFTAAEKIYRIDQI